MACGFWQDIGGVRGPAPDLAEANALAVRNKVKVIGAGLAKPGHVKH
jgi:hypothetical protein